MTSVRFPFRIFNRLRRKDRVVQSVTQGNSSRNVALEVGCYASNKVNPNSVCSGHATANSQSDAYNSVQVGVARSMVEVEYGQLKGLKTDYALSPLHASEYGGYGHGFVAHDGSSKIFVWDATKGCMVPYRESIGRRIRRSVDAFAQAWRLGHG